jgi:hypothetical protein
MDQVVDDRKGIVMALGGKRVPKLDFLSLVIAINKLCQTLE